MTGGDPAAVADPGLLLWTGGWDSTFRLLQRIFDPSPEPVPTAYVIDRHRPSTARELAAMAEIRAALVAGWEVETDLLPPTVIYDRAQFTIRPVVAQEYQALRAVAHVGSQYEWLAECAEALGWQGVEMCMPRHDPPSELQRQVFSGLPDRPGGAAPVRSSRPGTDLFRYWSFPLLGWSKADMSAEADRRGWHDLMELTWFCHNPVGSLPCGVCAPCRLAPESGRDLRFARWGRVRRAYAVGVGTLRRRWRDRRGSSGR